MGVPQTLDPKPGDTLDGALRRLAELTQGDTPQGDAHVTDSVEVSVRRIETRMESPSGDTPNDQAIPKRGTPT